MTFGTHGLKHHYRPSAQSGSASMLGPTEKWDHAGRTKTQRRNCWVREVPIHRTLGQEVAPISPGWWLSPSPLKNMSERQWGWWHSQYRESHKIHVPNFQTTNQSPFSKRHFDDLWCWTTTHSLILYKMCLRYIQPQSAANLQLNKFCLWSSRQIIRIAKVPWTPEDSPQMSCMCSSRNTELGAPGIQMIIFRKHSDVKSGAEMVACRLSWQRDGQVASPGSSVADSAGWPNNCWMFWILPCVPCHQRLHPWGRTKSLAKQKTSRTTHRGSSSHLFQDSVWTWAISPILSS